VLAGVATLSTAFAQTADEEETSADTTQAPTEVPDDAEDAPAADSDDGAPEEPAVETPETSDTEAPDTTAPETTVTPAPTSTGPRLSFNDEPPPPPVLLERLPPRFSYELAVQVTYGTISYWADTMGAGWPGLGARVGWGRNFGAHRVGANFAFALEGPVTINWTWAMEPSATWDYISPKGFATGASIGPALLVHSGFIRGEPDLTHAFGVAPSAAVRFGYSQTWTRIGRRFFVMLEPKLRYVNELPNPVVTLIIGSGRGY
jgi:hypothetical protein